MLTITAITTALGAFAGLIPAILQFLSMRATNAHAERLRELELEAAAKGYAFQLNLANANADIEQQKYIYNFANAPSGVRWVDALAILVRPYITLTIFHLWALIKVAVFVAAVNAGLRLEQIIPLIWTEADAAMLGSIVGFWFGNRAGSRGMQMAATQAVAQPAAVATPAARGAPTRPPAVPASGRPAEGIPTG